MAKSKNLFYTVLIVCGLVLVVIGLLVYINKYTTRKLSGDDLTRMVQEPITTQPSTATTGRAEDPNTSGLAPYPDLALSVVPKFAVSVKFVVEHRSALNEKSIKIRAVVVGTLLGENACPPDRGGCASPRIFLADTANENRNRLYDLMVIVGETEQEKDYPTGKSLEVQGIVGSSKLGAVVTKTY